MCVCACAHRNMCREICRYLRNTDIVACTQSFVRTGIRRKRKLENTWKIEIARGIHNVARHTRTKAVNIMRSLSASRVYFLISFLLSFFLSFFFILVFRETFTFRLRDIFTCKIHDKCTTHYTHVRAYEFMHTL